jgi:hypothetical protein
MRGSHAALWKVAATPQDAIDAITDELQELPMNFDSKY